METAQNKPLSKREEFEASAKPLMELLKGYQPHTTVVVTSNNAELMEGKMCVNENVVENIIAPSFKKAFEQLGEDPYGV